ncbi:alkaline phosphatase family protein [Nocardioides jensenii]|uniref:alkaline phosphatase family protein n=1 Tax=Nocardioides jensenii TaxID=1843 RepID=UPI000832739B|nr:alkaline phosphatase family protein [Nocardioides jensenii]
MRLARLSTWRTHPRILLGAGLALVLIAVVLHVASPFGGDDNDGEASLSQAARTPVSNGATQFRIASFNLLGAGHTRPGGDRPGWASGEQRMVWSVRLIREQNLDLIGFQEMQDPQFKKFRALTGDEYGIYPGDELGPAAMHNSIAWRRDTWEVVQKKWVHLPYFGGDLIRMPYVQLRHVKTGQLAWFANFHNPANARGDARKWRIKATNIEIDLANRLRANYPGQPVHFTGDMNERELYFCPVYRRTALRSANGGYFTGSTCHPPKPMPVDWIFGSGPTRFTGYVALRSALVRKTTDHPLVISDASIPPVNAQSSGVTRVVVLSVQGLRPDMLTELAQANAPGIPYFMQGGASTLNARTVYTRTTQLPNATSMITGRSVTAKFGGHGVGGNNDTGGTIAQSAGHYVDSAFGVAHDFGYSTALYAQDPDMAMIRRSYDDRHGGLDREARSNGRDKISTYERSRSSALLVRDLTRKLATSPARFSYLQLSDLYTVGHKYGFMSARYKTSARRVDELVRRIRVAINRSSTLKGRTLVVLTSEHAGYRRTNTNPAALRNHQVPFVVWGPSVPRGADLYAINPALADPGRTRPGYNQTQPVRNSDAANLVMTALRLPSIPGSNLNRGQTLNVFGGP